MDCWPPEPRAEAERLAEQGLSPTACAPRGVDYYEYREIAKRLRRLGYLGVGEPYWHHFAQAGAAVSDAAVQFASTLRPEH